MRAVAKAVAPSGPQRVTEAIFGLLIVLLPVAFGVTASADTVYRSNLGVFSDFASTPVLLLAPLISPILSNQTLVQQLRNRNYVNLRVRIPAKSIFSHIIIRSTLVTAIPYALSVTVALLIAFVLWPQIGNPGIDPSAYSHAFLNSDSKEYTYSSLMSLGTFWYGLFYASFVSLSAALYAFTGTVLLVLVGRPIICLIAPFGICLVESIGAAYAGEPQLGLLYSLDPFGLQQRSIAEGVSSTLALAIGAGAIFLWLSRSPNRFGRTMQ